MLGSNDIPKVDSLSNEISGIWKQFSIYRFRWNLHITDEETVFW